MKKYQVILADPPWHYDFSASKSRAIERRYKTLSPSEIKSLYVPADKNCVLYLWCTAPKLPLGISVVDSWGFKYKTCAVWDKESFGMGYWFRGGHELLLVGTKGKVSPPPAPLRVCSVYKEKRGKHSSKPTRIQQLISSWYPSADKLELFARQTYPGWDAIGYEIDGKDIRDVLKE